MRTDAAWRLSIVQRRIALAVLGVLVAGAIAWWALTGDETDLTALSIAVAVAFGAVNAAQSAQLQRRQHTIDLLAAFSTAEPLARSDFEVARLIRANEPICDDIDPAEDAHVTNLLDFYEFVARAALAGQVDGASVIALRGPAMRALFTLCEPYVIARRVRYGEELYAGIERLLRSHGQLPAPAGAS